MEIAILKIEYAGQFRQVAVYPDITPVETNKFLRGVFGMINGVVTGLEEIDSGTAIPLSLVCKHPHSLANGRYTLLVEGEPCLIAKPDIGDASAKPSPEIEENYQSSAAQLKRFIASFCMKAKLNDQEREALLSRVDSNDPVMVKAFQLAEKKQDVDLLEKYLVMIVECGGSFEGESYMDEFFTDAWQHLNFGDANEDESEDDDDDDDDDDEDARYALSVPRPGAPSPADDLVRSIEELKGKGVISAQYFQVLRTLIEEDNEFILAAFEMYDDDGDGTAESTMVYNNNTTDSLILLSDVTGVVSLDATNAATIGLLDIA